MTATTLQTVTSADGTTIAYDKLGAGPSVVLVCGGSVDRMSNAGLAQVLASDFTVYNFDRRGRGDSGDTLPYAVEREIEDIAAVIDAAGGHAFLYGTSSGAALAFEAARALPDKVTKLALWEPPYIEDPAARPPADTVATYERLVAEGRRSDAVEYFTAKVVGLPPEFVAFAKTQPFWAAQEKIAHTLAYDGRIMADYSIPRDKAADVTQPTIAIAGEASFPFFLQTVAALGDAIPNGESTTLPGQQHDVSPEVLGPVLKEFFSR
ncbi:MAG TPA: alpha/beta hydrolase [Candidatus Limnocylindrales bacterium]|nr:alpha/beta hydrolase [Candidatus Limnocylindrales bacterium]